MVIPLYEDRYIRALGHIAMFEAVLMKKPLLVARTFQLADYLTEKDVIFYEPGDETDLVSKLITEGNWIRNLDLDLLTMQFNRVLTEFTEEENRLN